MSVARKCKTVSFDLSDEIEEKLLIYAEEKGNFSRYVKRLIERDKSGMYETRGSWNGVNVSGMAEDIEIDDVMTELGEMKEMSGNELDGFI